MMFNTKKRSRAISGIFSLCLVMLILAGCSVVQLQAGLELPTIDILAAADTKAASQSDPKPITEYDRFEVMVISDITVTVAVRENPHAIANVFMVHGAGGGSWVWEYFFEELPEKYNLYAINWRGHFDSSPVEDARAANYVRDQDAVLTNIVSRNNLPVHIIGHSYGGATVILQTAVSPHDIKSVVLLAPVVPLDYTFVQRLIVPTLAPYFIRKDSLKGNDPEGTFGGMFLTQSRMHTYHKRYAGKEFSIEKQSLIAGDGVSASWQNELGAAYLAVAEQGIPITILLARYDNVVVPKRLREIADQINAELVEIESGHYIQLDIEARAAAKLVARYL